MNPLVYHLVSGQSFFTGMLILSIGLGLISKRSMRGWGTVAVMIGTLLIAGSSTPLPYLFQGLLLCAALSVLAAASWNEATEPAWILYLICVASALILEIPCHFTSRVELGTDRSVTIIGDSVTAGIGENEAVTWPQLLAKDHGINVQDLSHMGETAASAARRVQRTGIDSATVLLEIGGNDILGTTTPHQFRRDLDQLLSSVSEDERRLIMFELPLPPFFHEYGRIQRQLAKEHCATLIPKRVMLSVLADGDATLDSIHLSQAGHQKMAAEVAQVLTLASP